MAYDKEEQGGRRLALERGVLKTALQSGVPPHALAGKLGEPGREPTVAQIAQAGRREIEQTFGQSPEAYSAKLAGQYDERLIVSNGSKRLERNYGRQWIATRVDDAGSLRKGVYPLHEAKPVAREAKELFAGTVLHVDGKHVYQELGKNNIARHDRAAFAEAPQIGAFTKIQYDAGKARIVDRDQSRGQQQAIGR
ncbi:KfrB domain-containing protein [Diaphorobacter sp. MNS-0]|uniref:KfrB domain-containing protein n=1 Tax=Diaphorobacter sp. MNS-0 TaxID=2866628 RepID=UPI001C73B803|nr:KfrB domain-containing protein [Diaphorobacter sp. MNS-0]QYY27490.1 hypothetical protein K2L43_18700 [Diaphorobacter sp. MNS-0]